MTPRERFGVSVRTIGLILLLASAVYLISFLAVLARPALRPNTPPGMYALSALIALLIAAYLLRGARHIVRFAYGPERAHDDAPPPPVA